MHLESWNCMSTKNVWLICLNLFEESLNLQMNAVAYS